MIHINHTIQSIQLYNLLKSIVDSSTDYLCVYSYGVFVGWVCKSGFITDGFGSSEVDRLIMLGKQLEKTRRKEIALQGIS